MTQEHELDTSISLNLLDFHEYQIPCIDIHMNHLRLKNCLIQLDKKAQSQNQSKIASHKLNTDVVLDDEQERQ